VLPENELSITRDGGVLGSVYNFVSDNHFLGAVLCLDDLSPDSIIQVTFAVDRNVEIDVTVTERIAINPMLRRSEDERELHHTAKSTYLRTHEAEWEKFLLLFALFGENLRGSDHGLDVETQSTDSRSGSVNFNLSLGALPREIVLTVRWHFLNVTFIPLGWMEPVSDRLVPFLVFDKDSLRALEIARTKVRRKQVGHEEKARLSQEEISKLILVAQQMESGNDGLIDIGNLDFDVEYI
jgi:hypothetical protein